MVLRRRQWNLDETKWKQPSSLRKTPITKNPSWNSKIRHYNTVVKPEALYAAETLSLTTYGPIEKLEIKERKILRKILGPKFHNNELSHISNETLYRRTKRIADIIRKRRIDFYGYILRMDPRRITKRIFDFFHNKKTKPNWFKETEKDLRELQITEEMLADGSAKKITKDKMKRFQDRVKTKRLYRISEEERTARSERMKKYWENRKTRLTNH